MNNLSVLATQGCVERASGLQCRQSWRHVFGNQDTPARKPSLPAGGLLHASQPNVLCGQQKEAFPSENGMSFTLRLRTPYEPFRSNALQEC